MAAAYVSQGVDIMYLSAHSLGYGNNKTGPRCRRTWDMITRMGDSDTIFSNRRRHVIMFQEYETVPVGFESYHPLPIAISRGDTKELSLPIGYVPDGKKAQLVLGFNYGEPSDIEISVNEKICSKFELCDTQMV